MTGDRIRWTPEMDRRLIELFDEGLRLSDVAYWMGLRPKQVSSRRQKLGLEPPKQTEEEIRRLTLRSSARLLKPTRGASFRGRPADE